jgi:hypothetical protein
MVRVLAVVGCLLGGPALGASALGGEPAPVVVSAAAHHGVVTGSGIAWESHLLGRSEGPGNVGRIALAVPLPTDVEVGGQPQATPVWDAEGRVVALDVEGAVGTMVLHVWQPWDPGHLAPPLAAGEAVQRVTLDGATFTPAEALGLERRIRHTRHSEVRGRDRRWLDRATVGRRARAREQPLYLVADARLREAGGLVGEVRPSGGAEPRVTLVIALLFAIVVAVLSLTYRLLARRVRWEQADAYIRSEFVEAEEVPTGVE